MNGSNKLAPRPEDQAVSGARGVSRRVSARPEIRAAIALEEAGELQEAARVFEYAGEHAQGAALRLEHARTIADVEERMDVLREGCARNSGETAEGRALHLGLAEALLLHIDREPNVARRRAMLLEAARALEEADRTGQAGEIYENLGLLRRAAKAYEASGEVARLEVVLELLEAHERRAAAQQAHVDEIDEAILQGRRHFAHRLLLEHPETTIPALVGRLRELERKLPRPDRIDLRWGTDRTTAIRGMSRLRIGRAPDCELCISDVHLSRRHVELFVDPHAETPKLCVVDPGSRLGTFWNGEALMAGEPMALEEPGELALGMSTLLSVHPLAGRGGGSIGALVRTSTSTAEQWLLFLPGGGPLWLRPDLQVPARILFDRGYVVLDFASNVRLELGSVPLGRGANFEVLVGDRVTLTDVPLTLEVLA